MRRALIAVLTVPLLLSVGCAGRDAGSQPRPALAPRTATAGEVEIKIEPVSFGDEGARFRVVLDTHTVELDMELTRARLVVDGTSWGTPRWDGPTAGGHHRAGTLTFTAGGAARGRADLILEGFSEPVVASWDTIQPG